MDETYINVNLVTCDSEFHVYQETTCGGGLTALPYYGPMTKHG